MENKEITTQSSFLPANYDSDSGIMLPPEDIILPRLTLQQPLSKGSVVKPGQFYFDMTDQHYETLDCVLFKNTLGKLMFDPDRAQGKVLCGSSDRITPSSRFKEPQAKTCQECYFCRPESFKEVVLPNGKKVQQVCNNTYPIIAAFVDDFTPFIYSVQRTASTPLKIFFSALGFQLNLVNMSRKAKGQDVASLHNFIVRLSSIKVDKPAGLWYIPKFTKIGMTDEKSFGQVFDSIKNYDFDKTFELEEADPIIEGEKVV